MRCHVLVSAFHLEPSTDSARFWANSQEPCKLEKKYYRKIDPWHVPATGPKRALVHAGPTPGFFKSWAQLHKRLNWTYPRRKFLSISLSELQQTKGYVIKAAQAMRKDESLENNALCCTEKRVRKLSLLY